MAVATLDWAELDNRWSRHSIALERVARFGSGQNIAVGKECNLVSQAIQTNC